MQRILIASDDGFSRELIRLALAGLGAEVRCAGCGAELERLCARVLFDLIIVLQTAPFFCGRELIGRLRPPDCAGRWSMWCRGSRASRRC